MKIGACNECQRLEAAYAEAMRVHTQIQTDLKLAVENRQEEMVTALIMSNSAAMHQRDEAGVVLLRHQALAHGGKREGQTA